jgi:hypothetical protein
MIDLYVVMGADMVTVNVRWHRQKKGKVIARKHQAERRRFWEISDKGKKYARYVLAFSATYEKKGKRKIWSHTIGDVFKEVIKPPKQEDLKAAETVRGAVEKIHKLVIKLAPYSNNAENWEDFPGMCWFDDIQPFMQSDIEKKILNRVVKTDALSGRKWVWLESLSHIGAWELTDAIEGKKETAKRPRRTIAIQPLRLGYGGKLIWLMSPRW